MPKNTWMVLMAIWCYAFLLFILWGYLVNAEVDIVGITVKTQLEGMSWIVMALIGILFIPLSVISLKRGG